MNEEHGSGVTTPFGGRLGDERPSQNLSLEQRARLLELIHDPVLVSDFGGAIVYWNQAAVELFGYSPEEALGRHGHDLLRTEASIPHEALEAALAREGFWVGELTQTARNGQRIVVESRRQVLVEPDGGRLVLETNRDITKRKQAEAKLSEGEERLRLALTAANQGLYDLDLTTGEAKVTPEYAVMLGYDPATFEETNARWRDRLHPDDRQKIYGAYEAYIRGEIPGYEVEFRQRTKSGDWKWILSIGSIMSRDAEGRPLRMLGTHTDITERKQTDEKLRESERRFHAIYDEAFEFIGLLTPDGTLVDANKTALDFIGCVPGDVVGKPFWETPWWDASVGQQERLKVAIAEAAQGRFVRFEGEHRGRDGTLETVDFSLTPVRDDSGQVTLLIPEGRRITELKRAQEALREADCRKDEFLAKLSHELRNPLAPIRHGLEILNSKTPPEPMWQWARDVIGRQVRQLARLLDDLLDVSRITRNKLELRREHVDLAKIVEAALETSRPLIEQFDHRLTVALPPDSLIVNADPTRLAQVFSNLLNNAAKYTSRGGLIGLTVERRGNEVVVKVRDNGTGIAADILPLIFEPFVQADPNSEGAQGSLGIGLTLVKQLVEMHDGRVEASSQGVGKGSEFAVFLPAVKRMEPAPLSPPPSPVAAKARRCRVLVVDDRRDAADTLGALLELEGHDVRIVYDGVEAVKTALEYEPEAVLLDIGLPQLDGFEAARRIREQTKDRSVLLIAFSGWGQREYVERAKEIGFDHYLTKPVEFAELRRLLSELCRP